MAVHEYRGRTVQWQLHVGSHVLEVHYSTQKPEQLDATIQDMIRRGYDGIMVAEQANSGTDKTASTLAMANAVIPYPSFKFSISENHLDKLKTEAEQLAQLQTDMAFAAEHYFGGGNYLTYHDQPVVYVFDNGLIDWSTVFCQDSEGSILHHRWPEPFDLVAGCLLLVRKHEREHGILDLGDYDDGGHVPEDGRRQSDSPLLGLVLQRLQRYLRRQDFRLGTAPHRRPVVRVDLRTVDRRHRGELDVLV